MSLQTVPLQQVLVTERLAERPARELDQQHLNSVLVRLTLKMAEAPGQVLQSIVNASAELTGAHTAGISILEQADDGKRFRWHAVTGKWIKYLGGSMPREASPCGTILDRNAHMLMHRPHLHYEAMRIADPPIEEVILTPFYDDGQVPIGTLWIISHDDSLEFSSTDVHLLNELAQFTASAYKELRRLGYLPSGDPH